MKAAREDNLARLDCLFGGPLDCRFGAGPQNDNLAPQNDNLTGPQKDNLTALDFLPNRLHDNLTRAPK